MLIGYARVSTQDQTPCPADRRFESRGVRADLYVEKASGAQRDRPELNAALDYVRRRCGRCSGGLEA